MAENNKISGGGLSFTSLLTIVFIVLKLIGKIDWSWTWVLAPIWMPVALVIFVFIILFIFGEK